MNRPTSTSPSTTDRVPLLGCLARIFWLAAGPAALFLAAFLLAERRDLAGVSPHLILPAVVVAAIAVRWADVARLGGQTADGAPATLADWRRYAVGVAAGAGALWLLASVVAHLGWLS